MRTRLRISELVALVQIISFVYRGSAGSTAFVSQSPDGNTTSLLQALEDSSVTDIVIVGSSYSAGHEFDPFIGTGVPITRNVTVSGAQGLDTTLDLRFVRSAVELCGTCRWTFTNITVANDRRGTGAYVDFFLGQPGSKVLNENMLRLRPACTAAQETAVVVNETKRSKYFPNADGQQHFSFVNITYKGVLYHDQLHLIDYTLDDPRRIQEGRGALGGTALRDINTTRICRFLVDDACLKTKSSDNCVNDKVDQVLAEEEAAATKGGSGASSRKAAIAAGVAVAGVALVAALGLWLLWRHKKRLRELRLTKPISTSGYRGSGYASSSDMDLEKGLGNDYAGGSSSMAAAAVRRPSAPDGYFLDEGPRGGGWEVTCMLTTPMMRGQAAEKIKLGELLGAGSFGRVYKAVWGGREVAVKVIEHDTGSTEDVDNEVQMMMSFNHPNIVRAFHCITYTKQHTGSGSACSPNARSSHNLAAAAGAGPASCTVHSSSSSKQDGRPTDSANSNISMKQQDNQAAAVTEAATAGLAGVGSVQDKSDTAFLPTNPERAAAAAAGGGGGERGSAGSWTSLNVTQSTNVSGTGSVSGQFCIRGPERAETWLVQEYCDIGTLSSVIAQWSLEEKSEQRMLHILLLLLDAAQGLQVLHSQNVVHADLNGRNVLVAASAASPVGMVAKLADLGLSRIIKQHKTHRTTQTVGTMSHMPPELLRYGRMSPGVDVYAFGIMMWEAFTGQAAFKKLHYGQFYEAIVLQNLRPLMPAAMPADYQLLMEHCWATNPADRPSIDRVVECLKFMVAERQASPPCTTGPVDCPPWGRPVQLPNILNTPPAPHRKVIAAAAAAKATGAQSAPVGSHDVGSHESGLVYDDGAIVDLGCVGDGDGSSGAFNELASGMPAKVPGELTLLPARSLPENQWFV